VPACGPGAGALTSTPGAASTPAATDDVSRITRSFAGLAMGEAVARLIAFAGTLVIARQLGPAMYGIIGVTSGALLYFNQVADAGIELSGVPAMARGRDRAGELASATLTFRLLLAAALTIIVVTVGLALLPQPDGAILAIYALSLTSVGASTRWVLLGLQRPGAVAIARVVGEGLGLALLLAAVRDVGDMAFVPVAFVAGAACSSLMMLVGVRRLGLVLRWRPDWPTCRPLFARAPHLVGFTLLGLLLFNFDLIYLRVVSGATQAGHYAAAYTFIAFAGNLAVAWSHSVMPELARLDDRVEERTEVYATSMALVVAVTVPVAVGGILVATPLIALIFGPGYEPAATALRWLLPAVPLAAFRELAIVALIGSTGGERQLLRVNATSVVLNVALVVPIVPVFGLAGAAAATVATEAVRLALAARYARAAGFRASGMARHWRPLVLVMAVAVRAVGSAPLPVLVGVGVAAYVASLWVTGALRLERGGRPRLRV
jgi:O-antigen/teichoic acid export membrane protein